MQAITEGTGGQLQQANCCLKIVPLKHQEAQPFGKKLRAQGHNCILQGNSGSPSWGKGVWRRHWMTQDDKLVTWASYILSEGWVNSFYWQRNHKGKLGGEVGFLSACVPQHTQMCHIFLCTYQVLHNKIKHLKIKRKRKHKEKPSHSQMASGLFCLALSPPAQAGYQGQPQRAPAQLAGPGFSGPTQQETRASSWVSIKREWSLALPSIALSSSFRCREFAMNSWQVSFRSITELSLCSTSIPCLDFNRSLQPSDNRLLWVSCWSNSLSKQIKLLEHELPTNSYQLVASYQLLPPTPGDFTSHSP